MIGGPYVGTFPARKNLHFGNETIVNIFMTTRIFDLASAIILR
jgi:hypothetical protein